MLCMTTLEWARLKKNTDSFLMEHTVELQVSTVTETFGPKYFKL